LAKAENLEDGPNWAMASRLRLARRRERKPDTKAGQIRALWPEIAAALKGGQSVKSIRQWLEEDTGIVVGITSLTSYISRIRRRESRRQQVQSSPQAETMAPDLSAPPVTQAVSTAATSAQQIEAPVKTDPIAQAMRALTKPRLDIRKLHGDGDPTGKSLI
jgi:hypothetical protein